VAQRQRPASTAAAIASHRQAPPSGDAAARPPLSQSAAGSGAGWRRRLLGNWLNAPAGRLTILIAATSGLRLLFAAALGLGIDESYMVAAGRHWQLSYFDHPPVAWWLSWAAAHLAGSDAPVIVRLPFIALFALASVLMYRITAALFDRSAGLWATVVMNTAPVLGVTSATWVLPDGPLIAALLGAVFCLIRALPAAGRAASGWWLASGICAGLALSSKYSAVLTIAGAVVFLATAPTGRRWLLRPQPYAAALAAAIVFLPALIWNAQHDWVSFRFQGGRAGGHFHLLGPVAALGGAAVYLLPWIWGPLIWCGIAGSRRGPADPGSWLLVCLAAPPILFFTALALTGRTLPHWAAPGYLLLIPLLGAEIARRWPASRRVRQAVVATGVLVVLGAAAAAGAVRFDWLAAVLPARAAPDPTIAAVDWTSLREELLQRGWLNRPGLVVAATRWLDAGKVDYALGGGVPVLCLCAEPHEYGIIAPAAQYAGADVLIVAPHTAPADIVARYGARFRSIEVLPPATVLDAGRPALTVPLYLGHRLHPAAAGAADRS
jgi:4-amino-4-deoxy-L-arabinose transferase-like glycosyltransferase